MASRENNQILLFSGGQSEQRQPYYHYADSWLPSYLQSKLTDKALIMYIPWAMWARNSADDMFKYGQEHWGRLGLELHPLHREHNMQKAIEKADAIIVGGGSIHMLTQEVARHKLMNPIRQRVREGCLYIGTSAGSVLACPTRHSATEPPPISLKRYATLGIVPFQLTPHFYERGSDRFHSGPPPLDRIYNYIAFYPHPRPVIGIKDGSALVIDGKSMHIHGEKSALIVSPDFTQHHILPKTDLTELLNTSSVYYRKRPVVV